MTKKLGKFEITKFTNTQLYNAYFTLKIF